MILHIVSRSEWEFARRNGVYRPPSLDLEGFIHCSTAAQVIDTANIFYRGQRDLVLLLIDERKLTSTLALEAPVSVNDARPRALFPHIHGPLNLDAVIDAIEFPCDADESFRLPIIPMEAH